MSSKRISPGIICVPEYHVWKKKKRLWINKLQRSGGVARYLDCPLENPLVPNDNGHGRLYIVRGVQGVF